MPMTLFYCSEHNIHDDSKRGINKIEIANASNKTQFITHKYTKYESFLYI